MHEMIGRVARALAERNEPGFWDRMQKDDVHGCNAHWRQGYIDAARDAIAAMRDLPDNVVTAVEYADECASERDLDNSGPGRGLYFEEQWNAAIDAMLGNDS